MPKVVLLAWSQPASKAAMDEYDRWYREVHAPQVSAAIGADMPILRYERQDPTVSETDELPRFLAIYEIEGSDVDTAHTALMTALADGRIEISPALDPKSGAMEWYTRC